MWRRGLSKLAHLAYGFLTTLAPLHLALMMYLGFHLYEFVEYLKKRDTLYIELREYYAGLGVGVCLTLLGLT